MPVRKSLVAISCLCLAFSAYGQTPPTSTGTTTPNDGAGLVTDPLWMGYGDGISGPMPNPADLPPIPASWLKSAWDPQPILDFRTEAVFLQPDFPDSEPIANQVRLLDQLNFINHEVRVTETSQLIAAFRAVAEWHITPNFSVEAAGFSLDGPKQLNSPLSDQDLTFFMERNRMPPFRNRSGFLTPLPAGFPSEAEDLRLDWFFQTSGVDMTFMHHWYPLRGHVSDLALGIGGRWLGVDESIVVTATDDIDPTNILVGQLGVNTENNLGGPQITFRARVQGPGPRIRSVGELKIGLMVSDTIAETLVGVSNRVVSQGEYHRTEFAGLFESNFYIELFITEHVTVFSGFQLFYVDRIFRASEQISNDLDIFVSEQKSLGSLFMWGPRAGLAVSW